MRDLIKLYRNPDAAPVETGSPMLDAMNQAEHEAANPPAGDPPAAAAPAEGETPKTKFAWGDEDRRKSRQEFKDDDEIDLGYEEEKDGVKTPAKAKIAHVRETAKWLKENEKIINAALGMREEFKKQPELGQWFNATWAKIFEGGKYNAEAVTRMNTMLEAKQEAVVDKIEDNADDIAEAEKELAELDPESPQAKILKKTLNGMKRDRATLKQALDANKQLQSKIDGLDKFKTGLEDKDKKSQEEAAAKQASELFDKELGALTSKENKQGYQFEDSDDAKDFENSVRDLVADLAAQGKITTDEQFAKAIREAAKTSFEKVSRRNERIINGWLKKRGQQPSKEAVPPKEEKEKSEDSESIHDAIVRELSQK